MNITELRAQSEKSLRQQLDEAKAKLRELTFQLSSNQLKNVRAIRVIRKEIAQIKTVLRDVTDQSST